MKISFIRNIVFLLVTSGLTFCNHKTNNNSSMENQTFKTETVTYTVDNITMKSFVAYLDSTDNQTPQGLQDLGIQLANNKKPIVLVIPEWWGLNSYTKDRASQLARLGFFAMAVDLYGDGATVDNPQKAGEMATPFYKNPQMAKMRFDAALQKIKTFDQADTNRVAAIGYCFGGAQVLNMARMGEDLKGVVSFHGNLIGVPLNKDILKAKILVCHGADDQFVKGDEVNLFKKQMDSIKADYKFIAYPGATHAFTNPAATETGKKFSMPIAYNAAADTASWHEMKNFLGQVFK